MGLALRLLKSICIFMRNVVKW